MRRRSAKTFLALEKGKCGIPFWQIWSASALSNFLTDISTNAAVLTFEVGFPYRRIWEAPARGHRQLSTKKEELTYRMSWHWQLGRKFWHSQLPTKKEELNLRTNALSLFQKA
jgi:hypothetical protein